MLVLASIVDWANALPLIIGVFGIGGLIFTALKYNRDDSTAVLSQQNTIVNEMKLLNDELRTTAAELRAERDVLRKQVDNLQAERSEWYGHTPSDTDS